MYNLLGIQYLIDGLVATINIYNESEMYRVYHTDCLYTICSALGNRPTARYFDIIHPDKNDKNDERSCNEITSERLERFGIEVVD